MTIKKLKSTLPDKPSELILVALKDLIKCERSKKYKVDMTIWHQKEWPDAPACSVCLGGSVMAKSFDANPNEVLEPYNMKHLRVSDRRKLKALDHFRRGNIWCGLESMRLPLKRLYKIDSHMDVQFYSESPTKFKADMRKMAKYLKSKGL